VYDEVLLGYQPGQMVDSLRELHHTQSLGKQQISLGFCVFVFVFSPFYRLQEPNVTITQSIIEELLLVIQKSFATGNSSSF
jgi:hypothetical protein